MRYDLLYESSLARIHTALRNHSCGAVTAYRGNLKRAENQQRNKALVIKLRAAGLSVTAVKGSYIENYESENAREVSEHAFFVSNITKPGNDGGELEQLLMALGHEFDQDSILSARCGEQAVLIGTSLREDAWPSMGERAIVGGFKGGKAAEFMSRIRNRPFTFGEEAEEDIVIHEFPMVDDLTVLQKLASKDWQDL
jgi:hypothetical protein